MASMLMYINSKNIAFEDILKELQFKSRKVVIHKTNIKE